MSPKLESMFEPLTRSASVTAVYGEAISANDKTIIPVARIAYGFGGGRGRKHHEGDSPEGEGAGGGVYAVPIGVVEVTDAGTRFIALNDKRKLAGVLMLGFCLGAFWARLRR
ncbi:MAG TPA: spore germination protein GerW family protein [Bryobacteraceae bacterium]|nr:spore germination protein GerW family protein [Bryobacteraceae bacterium]